MITGDNFFCRDRIRFDTSGNAIDPHWRGNFKGLIEQLGYIRDLGFSAIWITPPVENRNTKAIETLPDHPLCNLRRRSLAI
jgi:glycosidase